MCIAVRMPVERGVPWGSSTWVDSLDRLPDSVSLADIQEQLKSAPIIM